MFLVPRRKGRGIGGTWRPGLATGSLGKYSGRMLASASWGCGGADQVADGRAEGCGANRYPAFHRLTHQDATPPLLAARQKNPAKHPFPTSSLAQKVTF